jgi:hypothetical protein
MHIGHLRVKTTHAGSSHWRFVAVVRILDALGTPVEGAVVFVTWRADETTEQRAANRLARRASQDDFLATEATTGTLTCVTDGTGQCGMESSPIDLSATFASLTVYNVTHPTLIYDLASNVDQDGDGDEATVFFNLAPYRSYLPVVLR